MSDFVNYDACAVSVANTADATPLEHTVFAESKTENVACGQLMRIANTSALGERLVETPADVGAQVSYFSKIARDASADPDLTERELDVFLIQRGVIYNLPESQIHSGHATLTPGDYLTNNNGTYDVRTGAGDFCFGQVITSATRNGGGYFRCLGICAEVAA